MKLPPLPDDWLVGILLFALVNIVIALGIVSWAVVKLWADR